MAYELDEPCEQLNEKNKTIILELPFDGRFFMIETLNINKLYTHHTCIITKMLDAIVPEHTEL